MAEHTPVYYNQFSEGFCLAGFETYDVNGAMQPPDDHVMAPDSSALSMGLIGYTNVPGMMRPEGTTQIRAAGVRSPVANIQGRREPTFSVNMTMGSGAGPLKMIRSAYAGTSLSDIPVTNRHMCLPVLALAGGAASACNTARGWTWMARKCLINSLTLNMAIGQPATVAIDAWALSFEDDYGLVDTALITPALIRTAGGAAMGWQNMSFHIGGTEYTNILGSLSLGITNGLTRSAMRKQLTTGDADPLSRTARSIDVGDQNLTLTLGLLGKLPDSLTTGSANATSWPSIVITMLTTGTIGYTFTLSGTPMLSSHGSNPVEAGGAFGFPVTVALTEFAVTYSAT